MSTTESVNVKNGFVIHALRNCGYNNYTAIADIIDNSLEPDVGSEFVKVALVHEGKEVSPIQISDNGCGMSMDMVHEAMALGSETGKNGTNHLGMYGSGLKTASLSIGQVFEVATKTVDCDKVNVATFSIEDAVRGQGPVMVTYEERPLDSMEDFTKLVGDHGTVVTIKKLDKLTNRDYNGLRGMLKRRLAEIFNKFILNGVVKLYIEGEEVPYINLMGSEFLANGDFQVDGHTIQYKVWNMPKVGGFGDYSDKDDEVVNTGSSEIIGRTARNQGMYIYRQNRLVGRALNLGLWVRHPAGNGFRCEIFVDGNCDYLFGSTFTKTVTEQIKDNLNQDFLDQLAKNIGPLYNQILRQEKKKTAEEMAKDPEAQAKRDQFYKRVTDKQNKNLMLTANRSGVNKPKGDESVEHKTRGPQQNPNPTRERKNKWLDGFREESLGASGEMFAMDISGNKKYILINTDHPFYTELYSKLDDDLKFNMAAAISCFEIAKQGMNYYGSSEIASIIDNFMDINSREVGKSLRF